MTKKSVAEVRAIKQQFGMWLGLPVSARADDEKEQKQVALKWGISPDTLSTWKNDPLVIETCNNAVKIWGGNEKLSVLRSVIEKAKQGHTGAQRLYLEYMGDIGYRKDERDVPIEIKVKFQEEK